MPHKYLKTVVLISFVIMIYQGIANSDLGIISQLTHQTNNNWAGPLCTALLFIGSGLTSFYVGYIGKYQYRILLFVGSISFTLLVALSIIFLKHGFNSVILIVIFCVSFLAGCLCSIFYNAQFNYINLLSQIDHNSIQYFGINMSFAQSSNIFGNLLSSLLIKPLGQFLTYIVLQILIFITSLFYLLFKDPQKHQIQLVYTAQQHPKPQQNLLNNQYNTIQSNISPLTPSCCFCYSGVIISYIYCMLSIILYQTFQIDKSKQQLNYLTFVIFIFQGVGELLGGSLMILTSRKIKDKPLIFVIVSTTFIISVLIITIGSMVQNIYLIGFGVVITGLSDCSCFVLGLSIAGCWKQRGVGIFNVCQSLTVAVGVIIMIFAPYYGVIIWISASYIWNLVGMLVYRKKVLEIEKLSIVGDDSE